MTGTRLPFVIALASVSLLCLSTASARAQTDGRLTGVVRDVTGAGLPGVTATATNQTTRASQTTTTDSSGNYAFTLPAGAYTVSATLVGFRTATLAVEIGGGGSRQLDLSLQPALSEVVTVTATKREETLLDVPFSVVAPTEEMLRDRGVENLEGVAANVGGFTVQNLGPGQSQVAMRGVSAGQIVRDQPGVKEQVGVYLDESVISLSLFTPDIDLFDANRVEVLRGPQGTLYGSGSLSGTVRYITNQPEMGATKGFAELGGSVLSGSGWNRIDVFNILANPFTTTRPAVTLGERRQFTQLEEKFTDDFALGDVNINYNFGNIALTSITSYTYRDVLVVRDATALTASITGGSIGLPPRVYSLDAPLNDATTAKVWTQEVRVAGRTRPWVAGGFFSHTNRDYGQDLPVKGFEDLSGIPTRGLRAPKDSLFFSDLGYTLNQVALFGEGTASLTDRFKLTGGLRYYHFNEDKQQIFDGIFGNDDNGTKLVSQPGSTKADGVAPRVIATFVLSDATNLNAQVSRGFRLGGINDPLNVPLCTPQDLVTFGGRETWKDETAWNYEVGVKSRVLNGTGAVGVSAFYMDIHDLQATVTAGSCSSRVIFNVPKARSQGVEIEFDEAPNRHVDFAVSGSFNDSELRSTLTSTAPNGAVSVVSGIEKGRRLPTVPRGQLAAAATFQWDVTPLAIAYVTPTYQHVGSRYTQVGDQDLGTRNLLSFGASTIGAPLTATTFRYDPLLPAYDLLNLRVGLRRNRWDISAYVNNVTDERALLSLDQERGTRARIGYLTNQPRTFGIATRVDF